MFSSHFALLGGKQPLMKDGYFENSEEEKVTQPMVFQEGPDKGKAKGLRQVCTERFGPEAVKGKLQDGLGWYFMCQGCP